ncbi:carboxylesterase family protein [Kutzneria sp. NPDC052558]|uniref:carboxylesterase family protein n=1 Tax=Kutzneria sp. NPDC052558 TaxID=3364121 RepID=UPI0037C55920
MDVNTTGGPVRGTTTGTVTAFRGIPYATAKRFQPPSPHPRWTETKDASNPGPAAPQLRSRLAHVMGEHEANWAEDGCLNLNVWTTGVDAGKPVLFWIHGGGFSSGSGGWDWYDGGLLAANHDIVVVTINYRLGPFGYLGADNLGAQDQQAALEWVHENIAAFGGDPGQITVGGQSAGAYSSLYLAIDPATKPLIRRIVLESGPWGLPPMDPDVAERTAKAFFEHVDRDAPAEQILQATTTLPGNAPGAPAFYPVLGGPGYPKAWPDADLSDLDVLIGFTKDEAAAFPGLQGMFEASVRTIAEASATAFTYRFDRTGPLGAPHCVELPYLFGTFDAFAASPMLDPDKPRTTDFGDAVAQFTRTGDPGWPKAPEFRYFV